MSSLPIDILSPEFIDDPAPLVDRMHGEAPVFFDPRLHGWLVGGYDDVRALEREPRLTSRRSGYVAALTPEPLHEAVAPLVSWYSQWMTMLDGADHRRLRRLAAHAFQPVHLRRLEGLIDGVVAEILDAALAEGRMEVVGRLAYALPRRVICEMVGIPEEDRGCFEEWTPAINLLLAGELRTPEIVARVAAARAGMDAYFGERIEERRAEPREGEVLSDLVRAMDADDSLTTREIIDLIAFVLAGAYDTTAHLIANGLLLLLRHPEQLAAVRSDPTLIDGWIEETLRLQPSISINTRAVAEPFEYRGHRFEPGQMVYFLVVAANRDPGHFPDPHRFDPSRANAGDHVAFGFGPHFCIGAPLARLEARRALGAVLGRTTELHLASPQEIRRLPRMVVRGLESLVVELR